MISDPLHRVKHHQLWIDKVRTNLDANLAPGEFERTARISTLIQISGGTLTLEKLAALPPERLALEFMKHDLAGPLPTVALQALKALGYPHREPAIDESPSCVAKVSSALNCCTYNILCNPKTKILLLDDRTAKAVADSKNEPITAAELQDLPHNPCLIEFYRPVEIAEKIKRGLRVRAVGFEAIGDAEAPAAAVAFYLDYWQPGQPGTRWPATIGVWFGGYTGLTMDHAVRAQLGVQSGSDAEVDFTDECKRIARNLWDFITSRSIRYDQIMRMPAKHPLKGERPRHVQGLHSQLQREVFLLYLTHNARVSEPGNSRTSPPQWGYRIEVLGAFHHWLYCARCGDVHRHDLLGSACRKCGEIVGPRANVRVEKYWHPPYLVGPEDAPEKDVVRDVHRQAPRR